MKVGAGVAALDFELSKIDKPENLSLESVRGRGRVLLSGEGRRMFHEQKMCQQNNWNQGDYVIVIT